jgi:hypothetical protein
MRRVVRLISVVPSLPSSRDSVRLIAEGVWPTCSAAAEIEPLSITVTKTCNSSDLAFTVIPRLQEERQAISCELQAASYKLQATSYKLQATSYKLQAER